MELVSSQHYPVFPLVPFLPFEALCLRGSWRLRSRATFKCEAEVGSEAVIFCISLWELLEEKPW